MNADKKTVYRHFSYLRCDDFARYLEEMAAKGWHLERWGAGLQFRRGEPEQTTYAVEVFSDASEYDTRPEPNTEEFAAYCEAAGWQLVDAKRKFVIFKKLRPDAMPIMTAQERLEAVYAEEKKDSIRELLISGLWCVTQWGNFLGTGFTRDIFSYQTLLNLVFWGVLFLASAASFTGLLIWKHRSAKRIEAGETILLGKGSSFRNRGYSVAAAVMLPLLILSMVLEGASSSILLVAVIAGIALLTAHFIGKKRPDAVTHQIVQVLMSLGILVLIVVVFLATAIRDPEPELAVDFPLRPEDFGVTDMVPDNAHTEEHTTVFGTVRWYSIQNRTETLYYAVYESDFDWVLDRIWQVETDADNWEIGDAALWGAEEVRSRFGEYYVVRGENWILDFNGLGGAPLTEEQIAMVLDALRP